MTWPTLVIIIIKKKPPSMHSEQIGQHQANYNSHDEEVYHLKKKVD